MQYTRAISLTILGMELIHSDYLGTADCLQLYIKEGGRHPDPTTPAFIL